MPTRTSPRLRDRRPLPRPAVLLIGPYDPHCGEYTFLAPPLGVWRLAGQLMAHDIDVAVFDPNCDADDVAARFDELLGSRRWDVIGVSTTGMTLRYDLELAYRARARHPESLMIAGGMEATFRPELMFELGPFDLVVLGEGEPPLLEICRRLQSGEGLEGIPGTAVPLDSGGVQRFHGAALDGAALRETIFNVPYAQMPYERYWRKLEQAYNVGGLPHKADREARLAEIRSVRLITLNYCPMGCTFCSSTNFLHSSQGSVARIARLDAEDCVRMIERIVQAQPGVRTVIFQDDIFVFTSDKRVLPLCEGIVAAKARGTIPADLQFISTNRIDAMTPERLAAMRQAGFRVLGFGIENFSVGVLQEFNKKHIHRYIDPMLTEALRQRVTPFLDIILTSPRCSLADLANTIREGYRWILAGCEIGMYPYVIPFSGAAMARDASLEPQTIFEMRSVRGTNVAWQQPAKILPFDPVVRRAILQMEASFARVLASMPDVHLPSRLRSLFWILCAVPVLERLGEPMPDYEEVAAELMRRLPAAARPWQPAPPQRPQRPRVLATVPG